MAFLIEIYYFLKISLASYLIIVEKMFFVGKKWQFLFNVFLVDALPDSAWQESGLQESGLPFLKNNFANNYEKSTHLIEETEYRLEHVISSQSQKLRLKGAEFVFFFLFLNIQRV